MREVQVVAAYRDLYGINGESPVGSSGRTDRQRVDQARARRAVRHTADLAEPRGDQPSGDLARNAPILT
jgi:hypothetical protein